MKQLTILGIVACIMLLFAPAAGFGGQEGPPNGLAVNIVNTTPVMVSGEVALKNTVENPLPVEGLLQVFQDRIPVHKSLRINNISSGTHSEIVYTVPVGSRLVIEYLTFRTILRSNENGWVAVRTTLNNVEADHWIGVTEGTPYLPNTGPVVSMNFLSKSVKLYADPGTDVEFYFYDYSNIGYYFIDFSISGYLESIN